MRDIEIGSARLRQGPWRGLWLLCGHCWSHQPLAGQQASHATAVRLRSGFDPAPGLNEASVCLLGKRAAGDALRKGLKPQLPLRGNLALRDLLDIATDSGTSAHGYECMRPCMREREVRGRMRKVRPALGRDLECATFKRGADVKAQRAAQGDARAHPAPPCEIIVQTQGACVFCSGQHVLAAIELKQ